MDAKANDDRLIELAVARHAVYRRVFRWFTPAMKVAIQSPSIEEWNNVEHRANAEWENHIGLPALVSWDDWHAAALAAGFTQERCFNAPFWELVRGVEAWAVSVLRPKAEGTAGIELAQGKQKGRGQNATRKPRKIDVAITLVARNPHLDDAEIARQARCDRSYLARNKEYQRNAEFARQALAQLSPKNRAQYDVRTGQMHATTTDPEVDC